MRQQSNSWIHEFPAAITVCDPQGIILELNQKAAKTFDDPDGKLVGSNVLECHPEPSRSKLIAMLAEGKRNIYTIEKKGVYKLIFQSPWYKEGCFSGFVEISFLLPNGLNDLQPRSS